MKRTGPSRAFIGVFLFVVFAALLAALVLSETQAQTQARSLDASLQERQTADREDALLRSVQGALGPQALLADGRRGAALEAVARSADSPALAAWALSPGTARPQAILDALCAGKGWTSALLEDRKGRVAASWPIKASGVDLSMDPYFKALSDPSMGPGIVRHGYAWSPATRKSAARVQLVAACGVADRSGNFAGLLKVRQDALHILFGQESPAFGPLLGQGAQVAYALGDGHELYDSAGPGFSLTSRPGFDGLFQALLDAPLGSLDSARGGAVAAWQRVGSASRGASPEDVLSLVAIVPFASEAPPAALPSFHGIPLVLPSRPIQGLVLLGVLALLLALLLLARPAQDGALEGSGSGQSSSPASPPPFVSIPPPAQPAVEPGALKRLEDELAMVQTALSESHQEREKELRDLERLRVQAEEGRSALELSRRESARLSSEAQDLRTKLTDLNAARKPAAEAAIPDREHEAARLAAVNTLSEELKATLEVIKNYINSLLGGQGSFGDAQQEFLGLVINKSARLERLIGDLVDLSEIGMGLNPRRLETAPLAALVQEAVVNARPQAENKAVVLDWDEQAASQASVRVDRERMGTLLRGLLSQAVKVSPRNEKVALSLAETDSSLDLAVSDLGLALAPERAAKIFGQFHGVDSQAGPEFVGAGLRFAIIRSVAEAHGGTISVKPSATGRGKVFVLSLPKAAGHAPLPLPAAPAPVSEPVSAPAPSPLVKPGSPLPALPKLPLTSPLSFAASGPVPAPGSTAFPASLPSPPPPPVPRNEAQARPATPVAHKPAPLDDTFNAPWKRKEVGLSDDLDELMNLSGLPAAPKPPAPVLGGAPSSASTTTPPAAPPKPSLGTAGAEFDALFGPSPAPPAAAEQGKGAMDTLDDLNKLLGQ